MKTVTYVLVLNLLHLQNSQFCSKQLLPLLIWRSWHNSLISKELSPRKLQFMLIKEGKIDLTTPVILKEEKKISIKKEKIGNIVMRRQQAGDVFSQLQCRTRSQEWWGALPDRHRGRSRYTLLQMTKPAAPAAGKCIWTLTNSLNLPCLVVTPLQWSKSRLTIFAEGKNIKEGNKVVFTAWLTKLGKTPAHN